MVRFGTGTIDLGTGTVRFGTDTARFEYDDKFGGCTVITKNIAIYKKIQRAIYSSHFAIFKFAYFIPKYLQY